MVEVDVPRTLESLQMGFVPVPQLDAGQASTSYKVRGRQLRVDLLTPAPGTRSDPVYIPRFKAAAAPVKFLSLLMEDAEPTAAVHRGGAILVVVPDPARFALHKLLVSQTRSMVQQTKSGKDLHQAALLLEALGEDRPDDLEDAAVRFRASGPSVAGKVLRGARAVETRWPDAAGGLDVVRGTLQA